MATINTSHAKARIIVNMLLECGVAFAYRQNVGTSENHREAIEVSADRAELLNECLHLATGRLEREAEAIRKVVRGKA